MLAILVRQSLGLLVMFGELHRSLTALGQQRPVGQERLLLPRRDVGAFCEATLLWSRPRQRHGGPELSLLLLCSFKHPAPHLDPNEPFLLCDFIFHYVSARERACNSNLTQYLLQVLQLLATEGSWERDMMPEQENTFVALQSL